MLRSLEKIRFSIGAQINFFFGFLLFTFAGFVVYNYIIITQIDERYKKETDQYYEIMELKNDFQSCDKSLEEYMKNGNRTVLSDLNNRYELVIDRLNRLYRSIKDEEARYLIKSIYNSYESYYQECCNATYLYSMKNNEYVFSINASSLIMSYLTNYADDLLKYTLDISLQTKQQVEEKQTILMFCNMIIAVLAFILIGVVNFYIRSVMTHPIKILSMQAKEIAAGNLNVRPNSVYFKNDIGFLADTFNKMVESIQNKIQAENEKMEAEKKLLLEQKKNIEIEKLLEKARFMALQAQTNPHFLFNTLNSINRTIMFGREEQALMMLDSLAELLRYNLTDGSEPVELGQEINITRKYLNIQQLRFSDRLNVIEQIDDKLITEIRLPRFTLQPIAENAVIHGLEPKTEGGSIWINVGNRGPFALIRIFDDGIGMDRERLKAVRTRFAVNSTNRIGIWNTCQRVRLFTGKDESFHIYSKRGIGTLIVIKIWYS